MDGVDIAVEKTERVENYCPVCGQCYPSSIQKCVADGAELVPIRSSDPFIGKTLDGRYRIDKQLGAGGMGAVYAGLQRSVQRPVAIKVIHSRLGDNRSITKRFLREAHLASKLSHPNSIGVIDFGRTDDGTLYLVMELVSGRNVAELLRDEGPFKPAHAVHIAQQICGALHAAHELGVIHRDLKPANIMVPDRTTPDAMVKVLDFGIAKSVTGDETTQLTQDDAIIGTPAYMSPEAVSGAPVDHRADLYALGLVLYEMLAGRPPFIAGRIEHGNQSTNETPPPLLAQRHAALHLAHCHAEVTPPPLPAHLSPALCGIVMRLLAKRPDDRFATASETREALRGLDGASIANAAAAKNVITPVPSQGGVTKTSGNIPIDATLAASPNAVRSSVGPAATTEESRSEPPRKGRMLRLALAVLLATGVGGAIVYWQSQNSSTAEQPAVAKEEVRQEEPVEAKTPPVETEAPPESQPQEQPAEDETPALANIEWRLESNPPAEVIVDGKLLGLTPVTHQILPSTAPVTIEWRKKGYKTVTRTVVPTRDRDVVVFLPKERSRRLSGRKKPPKKLLKETGRVGDGTVDPFK